MTTTLIAASAGTGKTYTICELIAERLIGGLDPARLVATTFTRKAAAELAERIRTHIQLATGIETARRETILDRLELAAIGTVHSVAHRFLRRHALHLGLSPRLDILDEGEDAGVGSRHLSRLLQECQPDCWDEFTAVCERLALEKPAKLALDLLQAARANALDPKQVTIDLQTSIRRWSTVIGTADPSFAGLDQARKRASAALERIVAITDSTKTTQTTIEKLRSIARHGVKTWAETAGLSKLSAGKRSGADACLEDLRALGRSVRSAPDLHADLATFATLSGAVVVHLERTYTAYKRERGLADFVDLECIFLDLARDGTMCPVLAAEIGCFVVDEFQDTNPIQLAIFRALQAVAGETVWVGDRKQAIFGFRGTDAGLVDGVWRSTTATTKRLAVNYRSTPAVVTICNELFAPVFGAPDVTVEANRATLPGLVECWPVMGNKADTMAALAGGIAQLLAQTPELRRRDIAVLVRTNNRAGSVADALQAIGIPAIIPMSGLFCTREGAVILAGLRVAADRRDTLAGATLRHLLDTDPQASTPAWFQERLAELADGATDRESFAGVPIIESIAALTPARLAAPDLIQAVIAALDMPGRIASWGMPEARAANLDAMIELARSYEEEARRDGRPATPSGLVGFLDGLADADGDTIPVHEQSDAVQILTYYKAKGLEWPVAICFDLDAPTKPRLYSPVVGGGDPAAADPLAGRTLRFWPWPFGSNPRNFQPLDQDSGLLADAAATTEGSVASDIQTEEDRRLLYVGCTRARDRLVLVLPGKSAEWLERLGSHVFDVIGPERADGLVTYRTCEPGNGQEQPAIVTAWIAEAPAATGPVTHPPRIASPSGSTTVTSVSVAESHPTGAAVFTTLAKADAGTLGSAVHAYLAGVEARAALEPATRVTLAAEALDAWGVGGCLPAAGLAASADAFRVWAHARWPGTTLQTEVPVEGPRQDGGRWNGIIDTMVISPDGHPLALIDHKTTGGPVATSADDLEHAPQLVAYREAIGHPIELWVHHVPTGRMTRIQA